VSISMDTEFCMDAVEEAITRYGTPEIFNTDQGSQFTSSAFTGLLMRHAASASRWTVRVAGATTCSSSGCGAPSSTRRCTCMPTRACVRRELVSAGTSSSITPAGHTRACRPARPRRGVLRIVATPFGRGSLTPQDPLSIFFRHHHSLRRSV
jgi:hypothetical protein